MKIFKASRFEKRKLTSSNRSSFDFLRFVASIFSTKLCPLEIPRHHLLRWNLHLVHRKIFHIFFFLSTIGKERNIFYFFSFEIRNSDKKFSFIKSNKFTSTTPPLFNVEQTKESSKENESTYSNEMFFPIGGILVKIVRISREVTECCRWREIYSRVSSLPSFLIKYT